MRNLRTWPPATEAVGLYLNEVLQQPVRWAVPTQRPALFVVIRRSGGGSTQVLDAALIDLEVWGGQATDNPRDTERFATLVGEMMRRMPAANNPATRVDIESVAFIPDAVSDSPRYVISARVWLRPVAPRLPKTPGDNGGANTEKEGINRCHQQIT